MPNSETLKRDSLESWILKCIPQLIGCGSTNECADIQWSCSGEYHKVNLDLCEYFKDKRKADCLIFCKCRNTIYMCIIEIESPYHVTNAIKQIEETLSHTAEILGIGCDVRPIPIIYVTPGRSRNLKRLIESYGRRLRFRGKRIELFFSRDPHTLRSYCFDKHC